VRGVIAARKIAVQRGIRPFAHTAGAGEKTVLHGECRVAQARNAIHKEKRKQFFFEKKNQKTFARSGTRQSYPTRTPTNKSFLFLFFKKEILSSFLTLPRTPAVPPPTPA
jgi:hypothetical protein